MDEFTAGILLQTLNNNPEKANAVLDVIKALKSDSQGPDAETITKVEAMQGKRCRILHTPYVGTVIGPNLSSGCFYNGGCFPVLVHVDRANDGRSHTFEYELESVILDEVIA